MNTKWTLRLFGRVELSSDDGRMAKFKTNSAKALLVLLALEQGSALERNWLQECLWPNSDAESRGNKLSVALYQFRGDLARLDLGLADILESTRSTVSLKAGVLEIDRDAFMEATDSGPDFETSVDLARTALAIYRGPLAAGMASEPVNLARLRCTRRLVSVCVRGAESLRESGNRLGADEMIEALGSVDPSSAIVLEAMVYWWRSANRPDRAAHYESLLHELQAGVKARTVFAASPIPSWPSSDDVLGKPVLTLVMVQSEHATKLAAACEGTSVPPPAAGENFVLAPNPLTARLLADRVKQAAAGVKVLIALQIMYPGEQPSKIVQGYHREMPRGEVWLTRPTAMLLQDHAPDVVMERTDYVSYFRIN